MLVTYGRQQGYFFVSSFQVEHIVVTTGEASLVPFLLDGVKGLVGLLSQKRTFLLLIHGVGLFWNTSFPLCQCVFVIVALQSLPLTELNYGGGRNFRYQPRALKDFHWGSKLKLVKLKTGRFLLL